MRKTVSVLVLLFLAGGLSAQFSVTSAPVKDGIRATADLPAGEHHRNIGGSDGAGLCVYTSAWHAATWSNVQAVFAFRDWMAKRPGGSYPDKFAATLSAYCREKGVAVPDYVQHTGGDVEFLKLALRTGRMPCVTYCGVDGAGRYGSEVIAHMVNLVHLDDTHAAILDNNFPGTWLWMTADDFVARWTGVKKNGQPYYAGRQQVGGGWAIVWLASPPAPYPAAPLSVQLRVAAEPKAGCCGKCGDDCHCAPGKCPDDCPVLVGQCPGGRCPAPAVPSVSPMGTTRVKVCDGKTCRWVEVPAGAVGVPPSADHEWGEIPGYGMGWRFKVKAEPEAVPVGQKQAAVDPFPGGVVSDQVSGDIGYYLNGRKVSPVEGVGAVASTLADDSNRWNLTAVGDAAFLSKFRSDLAASVPADVLAKIHVQTYAPTGAGAWAVNQFKLAPGLTLRKPATGRIGSDLGTVAAADYSAERLADLIGVQGGPNPKPLPKVEPAPDDKKNGNGKPAEPIVIPGWALAVGVVSLVWLLFRKGK